MKSIDSDDPNLVYWLVYWFGGEMERIGIYDAKTRLSELLKAVRDGGKEYMIVNRGEPMAVITQAEPRFSLTAAEALLARIRERREALAATAGPLLRKGETVNKFSREGLKW